MCEKQIEQLNAEFIMELRVDCPESPEVGANDWGFLKVYQIAGGHFSGKINGTIVSGGADWCMGHGGENDQEITSLTVFAKYLLKTDDGTYIAIENLGNKSRVYPNTRIQTSPSFHAPRGKYEWLNYGVYVATLDDETLNGVPGVRIRIYKML